MLDCCRLTISPSYQSSCPLIRPYCNTARQRWIFDFEQAWLSLSITAPSPVSPCCPCEQTEPLLEKSRATLVSFLPNGTPDMTETLQISSPSKLALIPLLVPYLGQGRHEGLFFYPLEPQATQRGPRNWVKSTHGGSGTVIPNVIFTEATREFLWVTAKSQQHSKAESSGARRRETYPTFFFFLKCDDSLCLYFS